jgi:hypothetical protein
MSLRKIRTERPRLLHQSNTFLNHDGENITQVEEIFFVIIFFYLNLY